MGEGVWKALETGREKKERGGREGRWSKKACFLTDSPKRSERQAG